MELLTPKDSIEILLRLRLMVIYLNNFTNSRKGIYATQSLTHNLQTQFNLRQAYNRYGIVDSIKGILDAQDA